MTINRRTATLAMAASAALPGLASAQTTANRETRPMYGLIGKMTATPGQRDALAAILLEGLRDMPGCRSYVVAEDTGDADALWITEVWDSADSHRASLQLPSVRDAIARGRPLIAGFSDQRATRPLGGHGLAAG